MTPEYSGQSNSQDGCGLEAGKSKTIAGSNLGMLSPRIWLI